GDPERVTGLAITPSLLSVLGVHVKEGRPFAPDEGHGGGQPVVLLGEDFWRAQFAADPGIVGRTIVVDERPALVAGVLPAVADLGVRQIHERADYSETFGAAHVDVWLALAPSADSFPRETHPFLTVGRLAPRRNGTGGAARARGHRGETRARVSGERASRRERRVLRQSGIRGRASGTAAAPGRGDTATSCHVRQR